jgi:hypothetical protein
VFASGAALNAKANARGRPRGRPDRGAQALGFKKIKQKKKVYLPAFF